MTAPLLRTWAEISLRQLRQNFASLPGPTIAPVVKADAYGHGAVAVSKTLESAGAEWLAVSCVGEGIELRKAGIRTRILVMGGLLPFERDAVFSHSLTPVVHSLAELREWDSRAATVHLKIDTGMSRLGAVASPSDVVSAILSLRHARVEGLMSHFASAEDFTTDQTEGQMRQFESVRQALREAGIAIDMEHLSNTSGVAYRSAPLSLLRPGLALYGYVSPSIGGPAPALDVRPILTWYARLLAAREIGAGTPVGYMARFRAPHAMRIGTVAVGYADGVPHRLSTRGSFVSNSRFLPILGAVSMDLTTVDLSAAPELRPGDAVTVLGPHMDAQQIATIAGEIPYSVLCGIGNRVRRVYTETD